VQAGKLHKNQPYDESLEVPDAEEIASQFSPTPRVEINRGKSLSFVVFAEIYDATSVNVEV